MHNKITPFQLVSSIKNFGGSDAKFNATLEPASKRGFQEFSKKNLHDIDDCVREEAVLNFLLDRLSTLPEGYSLVIGGKEKAIFEIAFKKFRDRMVTVDGCDIAVYDNAYQQILMLISE